MIKAAVILGGVLSVLALALAAFVVINWAPNRPLSELLQARWAQPPSTFIDLQGMHVHLRDEGPRTDPVPIVLLHGTASNLHTWDGWAQELKSNRRVIRFDLPGFGLTGPPADGDYRIESYVRFVAAMLDRLGVSHCVIAGNSFGGQVAWETALAPIRNAFPLDWKGNAVFASILVIVRVNVRSVSCSLDLA